MENSSSMTGLGLTLLRVVPLVVLAITLSLMIVLGAPPYAWAVVVGAGIVLTILVTWHARTTRYVCYHCGQSFAISAGIDFISPHLPGSKLLRCPGCRKTGWFRVQSSRASKRHAQV